MHCHVLVATAAKQLEGIAHQRPTTRCAHINRNRDVELLRNEHVRHPSASVTPAGQRSLVVDTSERMCVSDCTNCNGWFFRMVSSYYTALTAYMVTNSDPISLDLGSRSSCSLSTCLGHSRRLPADRFSFLIDKRARRVLVCLIDDPHDDARCRVGGAEGAGHVSGDAHLGHDVSGHVGPDHAGATLVSCHDHHHQTYCGRRRKTQYATCDDAKAPLHPRHRCFVMVIQTEPSAPLTQRGVVNGYITCSIGTTRRAHTNDPLTPHTAGILAPSTQSDSAPSTHTSLEDFRSCSLRLIQHDYQLPR